VLAGTHRSFTNSQFFIAMTVLAQQPIARPQGSLLPLPVSWWFLLKEKLHLLALGEMIVLVSEALLFGECLQLLHSPSHRALTHAFCHHNKSVFINKIKCAVFIH